MSASADLAAADRRMSATSVSLYALGSLGTGVFSTVPTILLLYYCTETLGLPAAWAALAVAVSAVSTHETDRLS